MAMSQDYSATIRDVSLTAGTDFHAVHITRMLDDPDYGYKIMTGDFSEFKLMLEEYLANRDNKRIE